MPHKTSREFSTLKSLNTSHGAKRTAAGLDTAADNTAAVARKLVTGDDVLRHFAKQGLDAPPPRLLHCLPAACVVSSGTTRPGTAQQELNAAAAADSHGPYDLKVLPRSQLPACYVTLSATGVVEVPGDGTPSLHTPIGQWLREASLHELLSQLSAGQHMLKGSVLHRWQANAQQQRFQQRRQQLGQRLLLLKPMFHRVLTDARSKLAQLQLEGPLASIGEGTFKLDVLVSTQQEYQQSKLAPLLARIVVGVVADVEQLAQRLQGSERLLRREVEEYKKDPSAGASQGLCSVKIKAERAAVIQKHTTAVQDLQRLPSFLRLLAQLMLQSQLDLLVAAVCGLREHLQVPGNALHVDLQLQGPGGVQLSPCQEETLKALSKGVLEHMAAICTAAPRLLQHPTMAALLSDPINTTIQPSANNRGHMSSSGGHNSCSGAAAASADGGVHTLGAPVVCNGKGLRAAADSAAAAAHAAAMVALSTWTAEEGQEGRREGGQLLMMVVGDKTLQTHRRALDQHVMRSYRQAQQVSDALSDLSVLLKFVVMWDPKAYKGRQHTVASLRRDALLIREWQAQLQAVLDSQCVGMLHLDTAALKATYTNTLNSAQATIAMLMVVAARRAAEAAIDKLQAVSSDLAQQPAKLPDFIAFRLEVRAIRQQQEDLLVSLPAQVSDLYASVTAWGFRLPHTDQALLEDLKEACRACRAALTAAVAFLDSRQLGMVALLDRQAKELLRQTQELLSTLEAASLAKKLHASLHDARRSSTSSSGTGVGGSNSNSSNGGGGGGDLSNWQQQLQQLTAAAAVINEHETQLDMRCTHYGDLQEAARVLQEMQQPEVHADTQPADVIV